MTFRGAPAFYDDIRFLYCLTRSSMGILKVAVASARWLVVGDAGQL